MFSRVLDTAKRLISRSPSAQGRSSENVDTPSPSDEQDAATKMVTTRGGTETPGAETPLSSVKKRAGKRELESLETPIQAKRQRKTAPPPKTTLASEPLSQDESDGELLDTIAVASSKEEKLPIRRRTGAKVVIAKISSPATEALDGEAHTPDEKSPSVYATPATSKKVDGSPTPKAKTAKNRTPATATRSSARKLKAQKEEPAPIETPIPSQESTEAVLPQPAKAHRRFGSEEPAEGYEAPVTTQPEPTVGSEQGDDASDSDEAPEVVTTAAATSKAKAAQAEADRAFRAKQEQEQAKRQQHEERIAEEQAQKRLREEKKAKKLAKQLAKQQKATEAFEEDDEPSYSRAITKDLPALLPDSLLDTIGDQRAPTPPYERRGKTEEQLRKEKLKHHIKFLEQSEKPAKDVKKGKFSVALLGQQNKVLAPAKATRDVRNVRESWLKGRQVVKKNGAKAKFRSTKMERRPHGVRGFLSGGDD
ncbi:hypothetical protein IQ07DRAFT_570832 [Pyrenochaeta sp. DS3sAY3a]|nr:hypothetical protein IQ07DRAFT_570832 [Pyrenochaeta sp. DS3sAY3a]